MPDTDRPADHSTDKSTSPADDQTTATQSMGLEPLEEKRAPRPRRWPWLVVALAVVVAAAIGLWLYADLNRTAPGPVAEQEQAPPERQYMTDLPAAQPAEPETPAEPTVTGQVRPEQPAEPPAPAGGVVQPDFVTDLAGYVTAHYHPAGTTDNQGRHGISTLTFKALNMRYGTRLTGLTHEDPDRQAARQEIFTALMHPLVLRVVFDLYADEFVSALEAQARAQSRDFITASGAQSRPLDDAHVAELLRITADQTRRYGALFESFARRPDMADGVVRYFEAARRVNEAYAAFADAEAAGAGTKILDATAETIKQSIKERERLKASVLAALRPRDGGLSDGEVLDVATWITRRLQGHPGRINSIGAIASLSGELADKLEAAANAGG